MKMKIAERFLSLPSPQMWGDERPEAVRSKRSSAVSCFSCFPSFFQNSLSPNSREEGQKAKHFLPYKKPSMILSERKCFIHFKKRFFPFFFSL
jgi:hypothetical protein